MRKRISVLFLVLFWVLGCALWVTAADPPPGESTSGSPYFWFFYVVAENTAGGMTTSLGVKVVDPDGSVPDSIASLTVRGPNNFHYRLRSRRFPHSGGDSRVNTGMRFRDCLPMANIPSPRPTSTAIRPHRTPILRWARPSPCLILQHFRHPELILWHRR